MTGSDVDRGTIGDFDLETHQVQARDHLGDRVFHLESGVHLQEVEVAVLEEKLHRPRPDVSDRRSCRHRCLTHPPAQALVDHW